MPGLNEKSKFFSQHFVSKLEALKTLELGKVLLAFHGGRVSENSIEHFLLGHLKSVLVRDLLLVAGSARKTFEIFTDAFVVLPQEFQKLKLLPKLFLLT